MTEPEHSIPEQIWELADAQCSGIITESEMETLERLLLDHPEYRQDYLDYVFLHIGLASAVTSGELLSSAAIEKSVNQQHAARVTAQRSLRPPITQTLCLVVCLLSIGLFLLFKTPEQEDAPRQVAEEPSQYYFDDNTAPPDEVAILSEVAMATWELLGKSPALTHHFQPGTVKVTSGNVEFAFSGGADISVESPALFGMERKDQGTLFSGTLSARRTNGTGAFTLETPSVEVVDRGTEYEVSVNEAAETYVHVLDGQVEVKPRGRLPRFFWTFDQPEAEPLTDTIGNRSIRAGKNAKRVRGLVGKGAVRFNNRPDASILLGNGGGKEVGTGAYSVSTGITVEALVVSEWQAPDVTQKKRPFDYDEIFRKEDGSYRILLSFQDDDKAGITQIPTVEPGPCLSFGLFLSGMGYSELDMPLDGKEGRPTIEELRDGKPHHIVATYNGWTGVKAIYVDGKLRMTHRFPVGTMIISGGSKPAVIGNLISERFDTFVGREPFTGIIDEVAFYDYALAPSTVATHYANVQAGKDYFDGQLSKFVLQEKLGGNVLLNKGEKMKFAAETGEPVL
ncbi:LamG-like jellyroll fold domain-containing protein [uncultured Gimesia sp.]|uniref:LamG-like jellyroll fold domain-containing protein n=1 Tax=uncultured Gimesia sp. TaxID=1678688 RepID=UPI0030DADEC4|tara:strand:+ start:32751 stop:34448 length:1698 start_codon:yes stop_codon:yes gene_type:complete